MNRIRVLLVLLGAALFIITCAKMTTDGQPPSVLPANGCANNPRGEKNPDRPIVCVDDSANRLAVSPDPFWLHETPSPSANGSPAVQWFTNSGQGELQVRFRDEACVRNVVCNGNHCTAVPAKLKAGEKERRCKYDVIVSGHPTLDPEGVLTGCCVSP